MPKKPRFALENPWSFMVKVAVPEKLLGTRQVLQLNELMDTSPQSKNVFKFRHFMVTNKKACL